MSAEPWDKIHRVETHRSGVFKFQAAVDLDSLKPLIDRVEDAHKRFSSVPILPDIAASLEKEVLVSGIFGTNTIEKGALTEEEVAETLEIPPEKVEEERKKRIVNIRKAYFRAERFASIHFEHANKYFPAHLVEEMFLDLHKDITEGLTHPDNIPGKYRDNPKERLTTKVGDSDHGGVYTPPKCLDDIKTLMTKFIGWINSENISALSPLIRAPLAHYYFERIHPFWDGNGRVGRVIEAVILKSAGYKYAPFALSRYYLDNIDTYFSLFNKARKAEGKKPFPNNVFVEFFLKGMLEVLNKLHDRVNSMTAVLLFQTMLRDRLDRKIINDRQYTIVSNLMVKGTTHKLTDIQVEPWYQSLYKKLTRHTISRDWKGLVEEKLISIDNKEVVRVLVP